MGSTSTWTRRRSTDRQGDASEADREVVQAAAIDAAREPDRPVREVHRIGAVGPIRDQRPVEVGRRRHVAQRQAGAALTGPIGARSMHKIDVVQRQLARLEDDVDGCRRVELIRVQHLAQDEGLAVVLAVRESARR